MNYEYYELWNPLSYVCRAILKQSAFNNNL